MKSQSKARERLDCGDAALVTSPLSLPPPCSLSSRNQSRESVAALQDMARPVAVKFLNAVLSVGLVFLSLSLTPGAFAQITVRTLGGGRITPKGPDAGFIDGNSLQSSQFHTPSGIETDSAGQLFVADRMNGAIRLLDIGANRSTTMLSGLDRPIDVALASNRDLFILTEGDGRLHQLDRFGNLHTFTARFTSPSALAIASEKTLFITETTGGIIQFNIETGVVARIRDGLNRPAGIAVLNSGLLAVSEKGNHRILFVDPATGSTVSQTGSGIAGFRDGSVANAQFNEPEHVAKTPNGGLIVADTKNHRVRLINPDGTVSTVYGKDPSNWEGPESLTSTPMILPGWLDGPTEFAEGRDPSGVTVARDGTVYATETFYHLVREITGLESSVGTGDDGSAGTVEVLPPIINPDSGYFPLGTKIAVRNPNTNAFFSSAIFYTTDGTVPTTNSTRIALTNNAGTILWREPARDLTALRLVAFVGSRPSTVVRGKSPQRNEIGVTRDISAGIGSTIVIPISVNLRPADSLKSLQFRVEIAPEDPSKPMIPESFRTLPVTTNDFVPVITSSETDGPARFSAASYSFGTTRGIAITFIGTNANLSIKNFGVAAMLAVPIPPDATLASRYRIDVIQPSATGDGLQSAVELNPMPARTITAGIAGYLVGDSSPATWYNAEAESGLSAELRFGDGVLNNADVNNVFAASLGERIPYPFTDLFDAMDAYPEDADGAVGGDGLIRFLDWQVVLQRSLGLDPAPWHRFWNSDGVRISVRGGLGVVSRPTAPDSPAELRAQTPGRIWHRNALISAVSVGNAKGGNVIEVPVYATVAAGSRLAGLAFRATVVPENGAPSIAQPVQFSAAAGEPVPVRTAVASSSILCGWPIIPSASFEPAIEGTRRVGVLRVAVPPSAQPGHKYRISFSNADGAPNLKTQYDLETRSASIWVETEKPAPEAQLISDEWAIRFFGDRAADRTLPEEDPDRDGVPNWSEYLAGTDPLRAESQLHFESADRDPITSAVILRWLSAPGKSYSVQSTSDLSQPNWKTVAGGILGTGRVIEQKMSKSGAPPQFYRLRLELPPLPVE